MTKAEYVAALRELADYVESKEFMDEWVGYWGTGKQNFNQPSLSFSLGNKDDFAKTAKAMGTFKKEVTDYSTKAVAELPAGATVEARINRDLICKKVLVGTKVIPAQPERYEKIEAEPEREEEVYKWECPESFLDPDKEEAAS